MLLLPFNFENNPYIVFNFTDENPELATRGLNDYDVFHYVFWKLQHASVEIGIGGYNERRIINRSSQHLGPINNESCDIHLGIDFWASVETPIYVPVDGIVHSFHNTDTPRDVYNSTTIPAEYGPTIILEHNTEGFPRYSLYGHLARKSLFGLHEGKPVKAGDFLAELGSYTENRGWHPHLHFQLMHDLMGYRGNFPQVCRPSDRSEWLANCPDPNQWLGIKNL